MSWQDVIDEYRSPEPGFNPRDLFNRERWRLARHLVDARSDKEALARWADDGGREPE